MAARRLLGSLLALAFATGVMPAGAEAAPGLASENHVFPAPTVDSTDIDAAFAPNGFAAVAWIEQIAANEGVVNVALRPPGGDWSAPVRLTTRSAGDPPTGRSLSGLHVAVNANGDTAAAWEERGAPSTFTVGVSSRPAGGEFRKPELFDPATTGRVGVDASGTVTFAYGVDTAMSDGQAVRTAPAGASLLGATPQPLSNTCGAFDMDLAVAPSGDAIVGYACNGMAFGVRKNGTWTTSTPFVESSVSCPTIGTSTTYSGVRVDVDGGGRPVGVVQRNESSSNCSMFPTTTHSTAIMLAVPAGGAMAAGPQVAASGVATSTGAEPNAVLAPTVGIGGGSVVVEWISGNDTSIAFRPETRTYPDNGAASPGPPEPIGAFGGSASDGEIGVDAAGKALVTWMQMVDGERVEFAAFRPQGGSFGQPLRVSDSSGAVSATSSGVSDQGDGVIAFLQGPTPGSVAHARGFDATAPQLNGVSIPAAPRARVPAPFAAGAFDVWGPVSFTWNFGDGTAAGATPTHAFSSTGLASVTVTARDSVGNSSAQTGEVIVRPSAPRITNLSQTHSAFRVGNKPTATARRRRAPVGTTFRFQLDTRAAVAIEIARAVPGRRSGKRCVKPTRRLAGKRRCTRFVRRGTLKRAATNGVNRVAFSGRIGRRALKPGKYRASFVATADGLSSKPSFLRFRVVR